MKSLFRYVFILFAAFGISSEMRAQTQFKIDSMISLLPKIKADTEKVNTLNRIANLSTDSVFVKKYIGQSFSLSKKIGYRKGEGNAYWVLANFYLRNQIDYVKTVLNTTEALKIREELDDKKGMAQCYLQLAVIDGKFKNYTKAIELLRKARALNLEIKNQKGASTDDQAIAQIYQSDGKWDSAYFYYRKTLTVPKQGQVIIAITYINLISVFIGMNELDSGLLYIHKCDSVYGILKNSYGPLWNKMNLGQIYLMKGDTKKAIENLEIAYNVGESSDNGDLLLNVLPVLIDAYRKKGDAVNGFRVQTEWIKLSDSLKNVDKANSILGEQLKFEEAEQAKIDNILKEKTKAENDSKAKQQELIIYSVSGILVLVLGMSFFIFRSYRQKKKANEIISHQKLIVEEKQKEILDSIHYAKRIQQSLMPTEKYINRSLNKLRDKKPEN